MKLLKRGEWSWRLLLVAGLAALGGGVVAGHSAVGDVSARPHYIAPDTPATATAPVTPPVGNSLFGVQLDWAHDTPARYERRAGIRPAVFGDFLTYPLSTSTEHTITTQVAAAAAVNSNYFLTLQPWGGLAQVTTANASQLATFLAGLNHRYRTHVYVRFAQEMNGSWYPWGQQPALYIKAFRTVATAVHTLAPGNPMVWSPNYGGGYPFNGEQYRAKPGTASFQTLDTNHDGQLTQADDPYSPYYPGSQYVDWVGLSLYYYGPKWPWGANAVPAPDVFTRALTGRYLAGGPASFSIPNFYRTYAVGDDKPMAISETAALYDTATTSGASAGAIKKAWIDEVFSPTILKQFPRLQLVNWFEYRKDESGIAGAVDWRATTNATALSALQVHLAAGHYLLAPPR